MYYLDTSAAAKLILSEPGSAAMRRWAEQHDGQLCSSDVLRTELQRAVARHAPQAAARVRSFLGTILLFAISADLWERAAHVGPSSVRTLDALHLVAALDLGSELDGIVTYDERLADAAAANDIVVLSPR